MENKEGATVKEQVFGIKPLPIVVGDVLRHDILEEQNLFRHLKNLGKPESEAVIAIDRLSQFIPKNARLDLYTQEFNTWAFSQKKGPPKTQQVAGRFPKDKFAISPALLIAKLYEEFSDLLTPTESNIAAVFLAGYDTSRATEILGIDKDGLGEKMTYIRKKIDAGIILPSGYIGSHDIEDKLVARALSKSAIPKVFILGRWYYTAKQVAEGYQKSRLLDETLLERGYIPIADPSIPEKIRTVLNDKHGKWKEIENVISGQTDFSQKPENVKTQQEVTDDFIAHLAETVPNENQRRIVEKVMQDILHAEIAKQVNYTKEGVEGAMVRVGKRIDEWLYKNHNLLRIRSLQNKVLRDSAYRGEVRSFKILGRHYVLQKDYDAFKASEEGEISPQMTTNQQNKYFRAEMEHSRYHGVSLIRSAGRIYIEKSDLKRILEQEDSIGNHSENV